MFVPIDFEAWQIVTMANKFEIEFWFFQSNSKKRKKVLFCTILIKSNV